MLPFVDDVVAELRKATWPTRDETRRSAMVVLAVLAALTTLVAAVDWGLGRGLLQLFER